MDDGKRACIALMSRMIAERTVTFKSVYDYKRLKYCMFSINRNGQGNLSIYDYGRNGYIMGKNAMFYDSPSGAYFHIQQQGNLINGYDYSSGSYFTAIVHNSTVSVYDYEHSSYFNYMVN